MVNKWQTTWVLRREKREAWTDACTDARAAHRSRHACTHGHMHDRRRSVHDRTTRPLDSVHPHPLYILFYSLRPSAVSYPVLLLSTVLSFPVAFSFRLCSVASRETTLTAPRPGCPTTIDAAAAIGSAITPFFVPVDATQCICPQYPSGRMRRKPRWKITPAIPAPQISCVHFPAYLSPLKAIHGAQHTSTGSRRAISASYAVQVVFRRFRRR